MKKKVFSFMPYLCSPHIETDLELMNKHVEDGDEATLFVCAGELPACDTNVSHDLAVCNKCIARRRNGLNLAGLTDKVHIKNFLKITENDLEVLRRYTGVKVSTLDELLDIHLDECRIGKTIYSELVFLQRDSKPDVQRDSDYITRSIESCALLYLSFLNHFKENKPDIFYTFNGRFVATHPAVAAAKACNVDFAVHDRAPMMNKFAVVKNAPLHSLNHWIGAISDAWQNSTHSQAEKEAIGKDWFEQRNKNTKQGWFSFTDGQHLELPESFDRSRVNIVIFNSSESEYVGNDEYRVPMYASQSQAILQIASDLQNEPDVRIYFRVHPNLYDKKNTQTNFIEQELKGKFANFEVIDAGFPVKTYSLMSAADLIITFGSTCGIEAAYYGVPSMLLGRAWYEQLDACSTVESHAALIEVITSGNFRLPPDEVEQRKRNSLKYGYFCQTSGIPYSLFEQTDIFEMKRGGETISFESPPYSLGLKRELERRLEIMESPQLNPLALTVVELKQISDEFASQIEVLTKELEAATARIHELESVTLASRVRQSLSRRVRALLHVK